MIGLACFGLASAVWAWLIVRGADLRLRRARGQRRIGRLAPPVRRALPPRLPTLSEMGDVAADLDRRPPWYCEVPMPLLDRKD